MTLDSFMLAYPYSYINYQKQKALEVVDGRDSGPHRVDLNDLVYKEKWFRQIWDLNPQALAGVKPSSRNRYNQYAEQAGLETLEEIIKH